MATKGKQLSEAEKQINVQAFLKLLRYAEHTTDDEGVYTVRYGGKTFDDTSKHPNIAETRWGRTSTAAGAYQIVYGSWKEARDKGIMKDFTKESQDAYAVWKLQTRHAYEDVANGDLDLAIPKLRKEWASLPGATQSNMTMETAKKRFQSYVEQLQNKK